VGGLAIELRVAVLGCDPSGIGGIHGNRNHTGAHAAEEGGQVAQSLRGVRNHDAISGTKLVPAQLHHDATGLVPQRAVRETLCNLRLLVHPANEDPAGMLESIFVADRDKRFSAWSIKTSTVTSILIFLGGCH
jgi:hypothetical protein